MSSVRDGGSESVKERTICKGATSVQRAESRRKLDCVAVISHGMLEQANRAETICQVEQEMYIIRL